MPLDFDWRIRLAAFARLRELSARRGGPVTSQELSEGFAFEGTQIRLFDSRRGIWRPAQMKDPGAALTIVTAPPKPGKKPPYDDQVGSDQDVFVYRYEGKDPSNYTNVAVRLAMQLGRPLIYLYGIEPGLYEPIFPCYVVGDKPGSLSFEVSRDDAAAIALEAGLSPEIVVSIKKAYGTATVKRRLHQDRFRQVVVRAYRTRCAVCAIRHDGLLDAAHILEDRDERGLPEIPNGMALCKIHHAAYDQNILGITPDYLVSIRSDILEEIDGPMLLHGLKEMNEKKILLPSYPGHRPNVDFLAIRYEKFKAA
jgi:putative restriction endonuclease